MTISLGGMMSEPREFTQQEIFDMMVGEYEFDPNHNQEDTLYGHLCEVKLAYDTLKADALKLVEALKFCSQQFMLTSNADKALKEFRTKYGDLK